MRWLRRRRRVDMAARLAPYTSPRRSGPPVPSSGGASTSPDDRSDRYDPTEVRALFASLAPETAKRYPHI